jgi:membrane fusion protein (multidrug efflux system)
MSETSDTSQRPASTSSKEEIKREVKKEIAEAISKALAGDGGQGGQPGGQGGGEKEKGKEDKNGNGEKKKSKWTPFKIIAIAVVAVLVIVVGLYYIIYAMGHETTDDAYTTGFVHQISSRVTSNVTQLLIVDNQFVKQGQILLQLDPTDFEVVVERAQANYDRAKADFDRVEALKGDVAISKQDYDQTKTNMDVAKANLDDAINQLSYCTIVAPSDGYIGNRTVEVGNRVTVGGALMAVVQDVWVVANYKETQLGKMKKNQHVEITVDAIPGKKFQGHIDSFSPGTGSTFTLLPPDNATGNFTKIVQRVPVKIYFEPDSIRDFRARLLPGLSVETAVTLDDSVQPSPDQNAKAGQ